MVWNYGGLCPGGPDRQVERGPAVSIPDQDTAPQAAEAEPGGATGIPDHVVLRGRGIVPGKTRGLALVSPATISGWGGIDPATGTIIERRHPLCGVSFAGRVLVFPGAKGSSGWSGFFQSTRLLGAAPAAMVFSKMSTKAVLGAVVTRVPTVSELDEDPVQVIRTGDLVEVDAYSGTVTILQRAAELPGT
ncbi:aconitase X swivel domain-containing protein [Arthrobacter koreensis]|uniref:aconitase X swivel domain-containing protein n=1 Tax=Arthrobacter koreensis TaxID=199136 RepID=UPI003830E264